MKALWQQFVNEANAGAGHERQEIEPAFVQQDINRGFLNSLKTGIFAAH